MDIPWQEIEALFSNNFLSLCNILELATVLLSNTRLTLPKSAA